MRVQRYLLVILAAACLAFGQTYTINTIAGGGLPVNIPGTSAYLGQAALGGSVAVDASGDAFITLQDYNVVVRWASSTQALTLVAGNGTVGFSGDSGPATSAQLNGPSSVAVDSAGNLYISDANNNRVRKVSNGVITTVAGNGAPGFSGDNGPATSAELEVPYGVAVDSVGNLYIADTNNYRIRKVSNGGITTVAGNGTLGFSGDGGPATNAELGQPWGIAVDSAGSLYIADANNLRIRKVSGGVITTIVGNGTLGFSGDGGPATSAELDAPWGVALDSTGNLYIADWMSNSVRKVSNGVINTVAGNGALGFSGDNGPATSAEFHHPRGVAVDSAGNLYIADGSNGRLRRVSNGVITTVAGGGSPVGLDGPASSAQLDLPPTIAADAAGSLYIAEYLYSLVLKVSDGVSTTVAGNGMYGFSGDGGPATSAELEGPYGVAMGSSGNLYIADDTRVREVSNGVITTVAGNGMRGFSGDNGPATSAQLGGATNVAVDAAGNLYISDSGNYRVRKVSNGVISTVAGNGTSGSSGDGGPATSAELSNVSAIAVDSSGNLYVAGTGGVREVSNGIITTVADGGYGFGGDNGPATNAQLRNPSGIAVDSIGSLYIADSGNSRVRKVSNGVITTVAGNGTAGFGGDNGQALSAELDDPIGVAADSAGNVYIADMLNDRVRILAPSGPAACSPASVSPSALSPSASGGNLTVNIQAGASCPWAVQSLPQWITYSGNAVGTGPATITVAVAANSGAARSTVISIAGLLVSVSQAGAGGAPPSITPGGVVNDASYTAPVAPGSIAAAFGDFILASPITDNSSPLLTSLSGISLQFGTGPLAPLFYASAGQINFQVPWELAGQSQTTLTAALNGASSAAQTVSLAPFAPAIFTTNGQGTGPGAILDSNYHLVSSTNPTTAGATILIYCTGLGPVTNQPPTGSPGPSGPLAWTTMTPTVTIGGALANVQFYGLAPGYVGLYQVNAQVPVGSASGDSVPIAISIGGVDSQTGVTVAVAPGVSATGPSVTSLSTATPLPLTPLYIATSGVNPSAPLTVQFANAAGFAFSESPIRIGSDGTVVAAVPLYVTPGTGVIGPGSVLLSLTQNGITTPPAAVTIQDLPSVSAYGVQPGQISHAVLDANAMILSRRLNEFQALQLLAGNAIDTSKAQAAVKSLLSAMVQAQIDIDQVANDPSLAIPAAVAKNGSLSSFDASSLDLMDRVTAVFLTQTFGTLLSQAPQTSPSLRALLLEAYRPADSGSSLLDVLAILTPLEKANVATGLADTFVTLTKNALQGNSTTLLQLMDQVTASVGGPTSLIGTVAQNPLVGAWGAAISNVYLVTNDIVDVLAFGGAAVTNNQALWNAAIDEMQQNTQANMVALASLTAAYPPIAGTNFALGVSAVATLINVGSNINAIMGPQTDAGTSIIGNSQLTPTIITSDLLSGDGNVDLSGDSYVRQAGVTFQLGGTTTLNSLTAVNGDYSVLFPIGVAGINYSNTQAQVVDPISGQTLGSYSVNLSNPTVDNQFPPVTANYPSEPSGYIESQCQEILGASDLFIYDDILLIGDSESTDPYLASLISPAQAFAYLAGDLAERTSVLTSSGCWAELDSIPQSSPKWP